MPHVLDRRAFVLAVLIAGLAAAPSARAQSLGFGEAGDQTPVEVLADNGIEWLRDGKRFVARGNAQATRGDTTVHADALTAHYREGAGSKSELWRLDADGRVRITSPTETATGDTAVYDIDAKVLVLRGKPAAKLVTPDTVITATDTLEYWSEKRLAVARGNAYVSREGRTLTADLLSAHFVSANAPKPAKTQKGADTGRVELVDAFGNVTIKTKTETVTGERGRYNAKTGIATILNNVTLTRDKDTLKGEYAVVNMNTGVSTLYAAAPGAKVDKPAPVRGVFTPKSADPAPGAK